ncbi:hypothetical protein DB346_19280 [Verrucomicrobia bacterium LW23]|nr:hypothetical protein DB346_19280 [Verrucomicrobia bacterium LW23]
MNKSHPRHARKAQTFIFFLISFGALWLVCGLGLDAGMLYLHRIKLGRAVDAAILQGVALYKLPKEQVAVAMKHMAEASYSELAAANMPDTYTSSTYVDPATGNTEYTFTFSAPNGTQFKATLAIGSSGQITMSRASAISPARTFFMGYSELNNAKIYDVAATGEAVRRPRMIAMVLDRSGSMLGNKGYSALPPAVTNFLSLFDTNGDNIAIISYSAFARVEVPLTNKFNLLGTNNQLYANRYPQQLDNPMGMKFGGVTASDEGMRLAIETMMDSPGWSNAQTLRFLVFFTDGQFNSARSLFMAPTITNTLILPVYAGIRASNAGTNVLTRTLDDALVSGVRVPVPLTSNIIRWPNLTRMWHRVATPTQEGAPTNFIQLATNPFNPNPVGYTNNSFGIPFPNNKNQTNMWQTNVNVWLPPGSVNYLFEQAYPSNPIVTISYETNRLISFTMKPGDSNMLVLPGYIVDGVASGYYPYNSDGGMQYSGNDINWNKTAKADGWLTWQTNNVEDDVYNAEFGNWPDVSVPNNGSHDYKNQRDSGLRWLTMRNAVNLWSDPAIMIPEDYSTNSAGNPVDPVRGRPINPVNTFYPGGNWYWPVDGFALQNRRVDNSPGESANWPPNWASNAYVLYSFNSNPFVTPLTIVNGPTYVRNTRHARSSTNMHLVKDIGDGDLWLNTNIQKVTNAAVYWSGGLPQWAKDTLANVMTPDGGAWRSKFRGTKWTNFNALGQPTLGGALYTNFTGGMMVYRESNVIYTNINVMSWNGRPTHYFHTSQQRWIAMTSEYQNSGNITTMGNSKTKNYCAFIRRQPNNVTIYTVGMGSADFNQLIPMSNDNPAEFDPSMGYINASTPAVAVPGGYTQVTTEKQGKVYRALPTGSAPTNLSAIFTKIANKILSIVTE